MVAEERIGVPLDDALADVVRRMQSRDVMQIALVTVAAARRPAATRPRCSTRSPTNVRARFELRRLVQTLTAQGRMSRWIVTALPVVLFLRILTCSTRPTCAAVPHARWARCLLVVGRS